MKKKLFLSAILIMLSVAVFSQAGIVRGIITDKTDVQPIPFANVILSQNSKIIYGTTSDVDGKYSISGVKAGEYELSVKFVGYEEFQKTIKVEGGKTHSFNIQLIQQTTTLEEVTIQCKTSKLVSAECASSTVVFNGSGRKHKSAVYHSEPRPIQHNTEEYDKIDENNFKLVKENPLSTFSVDVDRASYANMRRYLSMNQMPPKDAIRIEELINYFDYDYPNAKENEPFSVNMEMSDCPWNKEHKLVMVGLRGKEMETEEIPASNLVFLIDVSGSMSSANKLPLLKKAFKILVDKLRPKDKVAIVVYAGAAGLVLEATPGNEKSKINASLQNLQAGGSTAGGAGIRLAYKVAKENFIPDGNNRVILATDGDFNVGESSDAAMERLIEKKREEGVFLTILGFGMGNYKDAKMEKLSNAGNGNYAYIDNILEAKKMFGHELWGTLFTIAKDVKIQVEFNPAKVKAYRLVGYENRMLNKEDFNNDKKDAGEIGCGHRVTAFYEIIPADSEEEVPGTDPLEYQEVKTKRSNNMLTLKLRYKQPDENTSSLLVYKLKASEHSANPSNNFLFASSVAEFGMLLRESEFKGEASYKEMLKRAKKSKGKDPFGYRTEFIRLAEVASLLADK